VTVSGLALAGAAAANYTLAPTATTIGTITAAKPDGDRDGGAASRMTGRLSATLVSCTLSGIVGRGRRALHGRDGGVRERERREREAGDGERADARRRGGRQLHAGADGDDDRHDQRGDPDGDGDGGPKPYDGLVSATLVSCTLSGVSAATTCTARADGGV
jgi:hypothetical protein